MLKFVVITAQPIMINKILIQNFRVFGDPSFFILKTFFKKHKLNSYQVGIVKIFWLLSESESVAFWTQDPMDNSRGQGIPVMRIPWLNKNPVYIHKMRFEPAVPMPKKGYQG